MIRVTVLAIGMMVAASTAQADDFPAGPMHDQVAQTCTQCHAAGVVTGQGKTRDAWADTVTTMQSNGANVSDGDFNKIVDYLAASFPAK